MASLGAFNGFSIWMGEIMHEEEHPRCLRRKRLSHQTLHTEGSAGIYQDQRQGLAYSESLCSFLFSESEC